MRPFHICAIWTEDRTLRVLLETGTRFPAIREVHGAGADLRPAGGRGGGV